jgi:hypothetical protein
LVADSVRWRGDFSPLAGSSDDAATRASRWRLTPPAPNHRNASEANLHVSAAYRSFPQRGGADNFAQFSPQAQE